jgi:Tol biopolymer transport system component
MVAKGGNRPRFSPDGKYIAYWTGEIGFDGPGDITAPGTSAIFIVPAAGGEPRQLCPDFAGARLPTWSPDGKKILFLGVREPSINPLFADPEVVDWWITPVEGGPAVKTGAYAALARKGINYANPNVWVAKRNLVLFSATLGDSRNVWQLPVSPMGEISGEAERLTSGVGSEGYPLLAGNRLVFASLTRNQDIWSLPIQADHGHPTGSLQRIVSSDAAEEHPYISSDGKMLAFDSSRSGNRDIWVKDLTTGAETSITSTPLNERWPMLSLDRSRIAFSVTKNGKQPVYVGQLWGGAFEKACDDCSRLDDWSSDGKKMLYHGAERRRIGIIELDTGRRRQIVAHSRHNLYQPHFSRDGQWICFLEQLDPVHRRLLIVPSDPSRETPQQMWIPVTSGQYSDDKPRFSPGGNLIYFVSDRDGFMCLWVQRLHPKSKRPIQTPFVIHHFHDSRLSFRNASLGSVEISVAPDKIVFNPGELTGNVWMAELGNRQ